MAARGSGARRADSAWEKAHGRLERRRCEVLDLGAAQWDGYDALHGRRQVFRIERERHLLKQGEGSRETAYGLTSLGAGQAGPEEIAALVRHHWHIENRLHYVRDFTYDEDRCRAHVGNLPRNLACLTNAAISIVRHEGRFEYLPPPTDTTSSGHRRPSSRPRPVARLSAGVAPKAPARCATPGEPPRAQADNMPRILPAKSANPSTRTHRHTPPASRS